MRGHWQLINQCWVLDCWLNNSDWLSNLIFLGIGDEHVSECCSDWLLLLGHNMEFVAAKLELLLDFYLIRITFRLGSSRHLCCDLTILIYLAFLWTFSVLWFLLPKGLLWGRYRQEWLHFSFDFALQLLIDYHKLRSLARCLLGLIDWPVQLIMLTGIWRGT